MGVHALRDRPGSSRAKSSLAAGRVGQGEFGFSVALSADGNTALIGGPDDNERVGAAWVFTRSGSTWTQQGEKLMAAGEIGDGEFGYSVALSADGNTALIGGPGDNNSVGAAWVFTRSGRTWTQQGEKLTPSGASGITGFGLSVALSADGGTALIGGEIAAVWTFVAVSSPTVVTEPASAVTQTSAVLNATVDPNGETVSDCHFDYGRSSSYGSSVPCSALPGSGENPVAVSAAVGALSEYSIYHFRVVATNATGTSYGADQEFATDSGPEYGRCIKVAEGTGSFGNGNCTDGASTNTYQWYPAVGGARPLIKTHFTTKLKGLTKANLVTVGKHVISCTGESGTGEYSGPKTVANVTITLTGCHLGELGSCQSIKAAEGEVVLTTLDGELGVIATSAEGPTQNKIGTDLKPASGEVVAAFSCGVTPVLVSGSVIAQVPGDQMKLSPAMTLAATAKGVQKPSRFEGGEEDVLVTRLGEASAEQSGLSMKIVQTNEEKVEVNSVV